jgi:hypothetical protein
MLLRDLIENNFNNYLTEVLLDYILYLYDISIWTWLPTIIITQFIGAFAQLQNATLASSLSVRPHGTTWLPLNGFS